jgi:hypothetical protein
MRIIAYPFITMVFLFGLCTSVFAIHETIPAETQVTLPGANAADLYAYIVKSDPYTKWQLWPGKGKQYTGTEPHGSLLTTYLNDCFQFSKKDCTTDGHYRPRIICCKGIFLPCLYKIRGYNPRLTGFGHGIP